MVQFSGVRSQLPTISYINEKCLKEILKISDKVCVVEENIETSGIGEKIKLFIFDKKIKNHKILHLCIKDYAGQGDYISLCEQNGVGLNNIVKAVRSIIT